MPTEEFSRFPVKYILEGPIVGDGHGSSRSIQSEDNVNPDDVIKVDTLDGPVKLDTSVMDVNELYNILEDGGVSPRENLALLFKVRGKEMFQLNSIFTNKDVKTRIKREYDRWERSTPHATEQSKEEKYIRIRDQKDQEAIDGGQLRIMEFAELKRTCVRAWRAPPIPPTRSICM